MHLLQIHNHSDDSVILQITRQYYKFTQSADYDNIKSVMPLQ